MEKWKKGTGGGSGAPENYCDWGTRDGEKFADYAESGSCDYLAYIYMLDEQTGFAFNNINDPAPDDTITEDSNGTGASQNINKSRNNRNTAIDAAKEIGMQFGESMKSTIAILADVMKQQTAALSTPEPSINNSSTYLESAARIAGKRQCMDIISDFQESIEDTETWEPSAKKNRGG